MMRSPSRSTDMTKYVLNPEQLEAHRDAARAANPNTLRINELRAQTAALSTEILSLMSEQEKYCNLMMALSASFDSRVAAVSLMSNHEIAEHLYSLFIDQTRNEVDEAVLSEAMTRLGWEPADET